MATTAIRERMARRIEKAAIKVGTITMSADAKYVDKAIVDQLLEIERKLLRLEEDVLRN